MKIWYIYTIEYYSAVKYNEIIKFTGKLRGPEKITWSEITQTQKDKYRMFSLTGGS